jgi:acetoin utilization deacetylase AcuC-like enzyme
VLYIHDASSPEHVERIRELCLNGGGQIDDDTFVGEPSYRAALHAAGGACAMVRALAGGDDERRSRADHAAEPHGHDVYDRPAAQSRCSR